MPKVYPNKPSWPFGKLPHLSMRRLRAGHRSTGIALGVNAS
jgi:hypothetical protein